MRTDAFYAPRERAREKQRQSMVMELDRQMAACDQKRRNDQLSKQSEREAIQAATKRSMDAELGKHLRKRQEEQELQQELRVMMLEKEERCRQEGHTRPTALSSMNTVMHRNGNAANQISVLSKSMDAARFIGKPLGREDKHGENRANPLDASPKTLRTLVKKHGSQADIPISSMLGGVVGTLGGGGGPISVALMATGGPFIPGPKHTGIAVQDRKLESTWYEGLRPEHLEAGRREARRREVAKAEANRD